MRKMNFMPSMVIGLVFLASGVTAWAQEKAVSEEKLLFMEVPMVETPSKKSEPATEAPAVITVITAQDIKNMGAKNLLEVLRTVPGFNILQDTNEMLAVLHGVYASTNQKFLLLRDGHRLNDQMFYSTEYDYSLTLANIKRIEIVRGPGSTLYGSAALCGVVNVITKDGSDIDGAEVEYSQGNYGQIGGNFVWGKGWDEDSDLLVYGSIYRTNGQKTPQESSKDVANTPLIDGWQYVDRYPSSYDVGLKLKKDYFTFSSSFRHSEYIPGRANTAALYDRDSSAKGIEQVWSWGDADLLYERPLDNGGTLKLRHYLDYEYWDSWQMLVSPSVYPPYGKLLWMQYRTFSEGEDYSYSRPFKWVLGNGNILFGLKGEKWWLLESDYIHNIASAGIFTDYGKLLTMGKGEYYVAPYAELEHSLTDKIKLNVGASYDYYEIVKGSLNPRFSCIWHPLGEFYWKLLFSRAFMNPSYFYRYITENAYGYYGGPSLQSEVMDSWQTELSNKFGDNVSVKLHIFRNTLKDLITSVVVTKTYANVGKQTMWGMEPEVKIMLNKKADMFANYTFQKPVKDKTDASLTKEGTIRDVPNHTANLGFNYHPVDYLNLNFIVNWHGKIKSPSTLNSDYKISPTTVVDMNLNVKLDKYVKGSEVSLKIRNLFDQYDEAAGPVPVPYPQRGRWFLITAGYKF